MIRYALTALFLFASSPSIVSVQAAETEKLVRYQHGGEVHFGVLDGAMIVEQSGNLFGARKATGRRIALDLVQLLPPANASKVFAVGMNFASHLSSSSKAPPPMFLKLPTSLTGSGSDVSLPSDSNNVHFEGELVLVIGKRARNVPREEAMSYIFGVTAGNDLTERYWQGSDLQWMRAKATDGFGPVGPAVVTGLDPNNLLLTTQLNGKTVQQENTRNMIHKPAKVVSYLSRYFTLLPGDMIFMGTPGRTKALEHGDVVSVTIEGVGTLTNRIVGSGS